jgi:hypothetical protein
VEVKWIIDPSMARRILPISTRFSPFRSARTSGRGSAAQVRPLARRNVQRRSRTRIFMNGARIQVSDVEALQRAIMTGFLTDSATKAK